MKKLASWLTINELVPTYANFFSLLFDPTGQHVCEECPYILEPRLLYQLFYDVIVHRPREFYDVIG